MTNGRSSPTIDLLDKGAIKGEIICSWCRSGPLDLVWWVGGWIAILLGWKLLHAQQINVGTDNVKSK
jgi:hypothetical protein